MKWEDQFAEDFDRDESERKGSSRSVTVGWTVRFPQGSDAIWAPPKPFTRNDPKPASAKSVQVCPAAIDFDRRHFVIPCPIDITLSVMRGPNGQLQLADIDGEKSAMRPQGRHSMRMLHPQSEWRHPERPIIQIVAPYVFVADEPCYVVQTAPYLDWFPTPRPGLMMGGRFPCSSAASPGSMSASRPRTRRRMSGWSSRK